MKMLNYGSILILCLIAICSTFQNNGNTNLSNHKLSGVIKWKYEKRPFCNAFTGCGRKRVPYPPYPLLKRADLEDKPYLNSNDMNEGISDLIDINAEPAVENVQKQIMSQAKIFEAIKEASKEIYRQKNKQKLLERRQDDEEYLQRQQESQPETDFQIQTADDSSV